MIDCDLQVCAFYKPHKNRETFTVMPQKVNVNNIEIIITNEKIKILNTWTFNEFDWLLEN